MSNRLLNPIDYIGPVSKILSKLPDWIHVTNVENVLREGLLWRFEMYRHHLAQRYMKRIKHKNKHIRRVARRRYRAERDGYRAERDAKAKTKPHRLESKTPTKTPTTEIPKPVAVPADDGTDVLGI